MTTAYNGKCAFALSVGKTDVEGLEKHKLVKNDTAYLFSNPIAKLLFKILPNMQKKADEMFKSIE